MPQGDSTAQIMHLRLKFVINSPFTHKFLIKFPHILFIDNSFEDCMQSLILSYIKCLYLLLADGEGPMTKIELHAI